MAKHANEPRSIATERGLRYLTGRDDMDLEAFAREAGYSYVDERTGRIVGAPTLDVTHQLGINAFATRLVADARKQGVTLVDWLNLVQSEHRFETPRGRRVRVSPDSAIELDFNGSQYWSLIEYETERVDADELRAKLAEYRHYYELSEWSGQFSSKPGLLFVCASSRAEHHVFRALSRMSADIPAFTMTDRRYQRSEATALGLMGPIWRVPPSRDFGYAFQRPDEMPR